MAIYVAFLILVWLHSSITGSKRRWCCEGIRIPGETHSHVCVPEHGLIPMYVFPNIDSFPCMSPNIDSFQCMCSWTWTHSHVCVPKHWLIPMYVFLNMDSFPCMCSWTLTHSNVSTHSVLCTIYPTSTKAIVLLFILYYKHVIALCRNWCVNARTRLTNRMEQSQSSSEAGTKIMRFVMKSPETRITCKANIGDFV